MLKNKFEKVTRALIVTAIVVSYCCTFIAYPVVAINDDSLPQYRNESSFTLETGTSGFHSGKLALEHSKIILRQPVNTSGATLVFDVPGATLNGITVNIPANSYAEARTFSIEETPIGGHTFGASFNPISPLIFIDNGGGYADRLMIVTVPVKVPDDHFAMGFYYIEKTGELEGISMLSVKNAAVTLAVTHFSHPFVISSVPRSALTGEVQSGFKPGADDWQFSNYGSYIAPWGQCSGQTLAALWYYHEKPEGTHTHLYNRTASAEKVGFWKGDVDGYKYSSIMQLEYQGKIRQGASMKQFFTDLAVLGDRYTMYSFKYAILLTGSPQYIEVWDFKHNTGHALIVYAVTAGGDLMVADPNFPGNTDRIIKYNGENFLPYNSAANSAYKETAYDSIVFCVNTAMISYEKMTGIWKQLNSNSDADKLFPAYSIAVYDQGGNFMQTLASGKVYTADGNTVYLGIMADGKKLDMTVYRDGNYVALANGNLELKPGVNHVGIAVWGNPGNNNGVSLLKWVDYKYFDIVCTGS